ncbi:MAG: hypothetical protein ACRC1J_10160, partial [Sandaracinobacteroides sp.]
LLAFVIRPLLRPIASRLIAELDQSRGAPENSAIVHQLRAAAPPALVDYSRKLAEARLLAASDTARTTAVARRLLAETPA